MEHHRRQGQNESRFRKVNESIDAGRGLRDAEAQLAFICECGRLGCSDVIALPVGEYERVRSSPRRFIVRPDHVDPAVEHVVDRGAGHVVVEKEGEAAHVAEELDPRNAGHPGRAGGSGAPEGAAPS